MKHGLLLWVSLLGLVVLVSSCAPAAAPAPPRSSGDAGSQQGQAPSGQGSSSAPQPSGSPVPAGGEKTTTDRMIVYNMQMSMEVEDTTTAMESVATIAERQGGFVVNSNFRYEGERKVSVITIKVPSLNYQDALVELRRLAVKVENEDSKSQDVTEEYSDLGAQLRNQEASEAQYLVLLKKAESIDEILKVQERVSNTRKEIERIKGRMTFLERTTDMASITINLFARVAAQRADPKTGIPAGWQKVTDAFDESFVFLGNLATVLGMIIAFSWWLILLGGAAAIVWRFRRPPSAPQSLPVKREGD